MPAPFTALYLDSNILLPSWPYQVPAATKQFLHLASLLNINVYLPVAVSIELEAHWKRETLQPLTKATYSLNRELQRLEIQRQPVVLPEDAVLLARYRSLAEARKIEHNLIDVPFGAYSVSDFFSLAARQEFPFEKEGKNFQDAVILYSVLQHNVSLGGDPAAFVSRNKKDFDPSIITSLSDSLGAKVRYFANTEILEETLNKALRSLVVEVWKNIQRVARVGIERSSEILERFLQQKIVKLSEVDLHLKGIHDVKVFLLDKNESGSIPVSFLADVIFTETIAGTAPLKIERTVAVTGQGELQQGLFSNISFDSAELT